MADPNEPKPLDDVRCGRCQRRMVAAEGEWVDMGGMIKPWENPENKPPPVYVLLCITCKEFMTT